jgi:hypothetical protein
MRGFTHNSNARMLGKAVQLRHCPATVSASAAASVIMKEAAGLRRVHLCLMRRCAISHWSQPYAAKLWEGRQ